MNIFLCEECKYKEQKIFSLFFFFTLVRIRKTFLKNIQNSYIREYE